MGLSTLSSPLNPVVCGQMALFVDVINDGQQCRELVDYVYQLSSDDLSAWKEECHSLSEKLSDPAKFKLMVQSIIEKGDIVFAQASNSDCEVYWSLILGLCNHCGGSAEGEVKNLIESFTNQVTSKSGDNDKPELRLNVLGTAYNYFWTPNVRFLVLSAMLKYAKSVGKGSLVTGCFPSLEEQAKSWGVEASERRALYKLAADVAKEEKVSDATEYPILRGFLATFDTEGDLSEAKEEAKRAAIIAIRLNDIHQCHDLLELKAVKNLAKDAEFAPVYELLSLFAQENLQAYKAFEAKHPNYIQKLGLSQESCICKMRLLTLASLAAHNHTLSYSTVAEKLGISSGDVEDWVIDAISNDLLVAKIDQLHETIVVERCTQRVFDSDDWARLQTKLSLWHSNVSDLLTKVQGTGLETRVPVV